MNKSAEQLRTDSRNSLSLSAHTNGDFMRDSMTEEAAAIATARIVSTLISMRVVANARPLDARDVQAVIESFMDGARIESYPGPMGSELYRAIPNV